MRDLALLVLVLGACADESSFTYSVEVPRLNDATSPHFAIEGHEGETTVDLVFDTYDQARAELSLIVTLTHEGTTTSRKLESQCEYTPASSEVGRLVRETVRLDSWGTPPRIVIDMYNCMGAYRGYGVGDCGC